MPGMGMGMGMHMRMYQGLRVEQRQELRLEQRLVLTQIMDIGTEGGKNAEEQAKLLERFLLEVNQGVYKDPAEFHNRCMKRVQKKDRSPSVKAVVKNLRSVIENLNPADLATLKNILSYGITAYKNKNWVPSMEFEGISELFLGRKAQETKQKLFNLLKKNMEEQENPNYISTVSLIGKDKRLDDNSVLHAAESLEKVRSKTLDYLVDNLESSLPENINSSQFTTALETIVNFKEIIPDFYNEPIEKMVKQFVEKPQSAELAIKYNKIPLPLLAAACNFDITEEQLKKLESFCEEEHAQSSRDCKRHLIIGAHQLTRYNSGEKVFNHTLNLATNAHELEKLYQEISASLQITSPKRITGYLDNAKTFAELYNGLKNIRIRTGIDNIPISEEHKKKLVEQFDRIPPKFLIILSKLGDIYKKDYPEGLPILASLAEKVIDGDFYEWRYSHEKAALQLLKAGNAKTWQENLHRYCILRGGDAAEQKLAAVKLLGIEAEEIYKRRFGTEPKKDAPELERSIGLMKENLRNSNGNQKELGIQVRDLTTKYHLARFLELFDISPNNLDISRDNFSEKIKDRKYEMYHEIIGQALSCFEAPAIRDMETINIEETDNYLDVLNVGVEPVQSCQRWTEATSYNKCLLAYVIDANKKVIYTKSKRGETLARTVVRLLPNGKKGLLLLMEPTYSKQWSHDHSRALVSTILQKAAKLSEEINEPIRVGYTDRRASEQYEEVFKEIAEKGEVKLKTGKISIDMPESMNHFEYSDALGGCLESGSRVSQPLHYLVVGPEED